MNLRLIIPLALVVFAMCSCKSMGPDEKWMRGKKYRRIEPRTGSNVPRWVEVTDDSAPPTRKKQKPKRDKKPPKPTDTRNLPPAPPPDVFR